MISTKDTLPTFCYTPRMKTVHVAAAVIFRTAPSGIMQVFATERGYGDWQGWWEFPGGKIEAGESAEAALVREIREELATDIAVGDCIGTVEYDYPAFRLSMQCFSCTVKNGHLELLEHKAAAWLTKDTLRSVRWLSADELLLDKIALLLGKNS